MRNTSSRSDTADWGKAIGLVSLGECLAVHTEDLADGSHIYQAKPATLNPHHSAGRSSESTAGPPTTPRTTDATLHRTDARTVALSAPRIYVQTL